jgi:predicted restriction endonuclease
LAKRLSEPDLVLPVLYCLYGAEDNTLSTSDLSICLRDLLQPQGEDTAPLRNRADDKFSQLVRNLISHKKLEKLGFCTYRSASPSGLLTMTDVGHAYLSRNLELLEYLVENGFPYDETSVVLSQIDPETTEQLVPAVFSESVVREGYTRQAEYTVAVRSNKLRDAAIQYYSRDGRITCLACGFDFEAFYGKHGQGFIEIHHVKPVVAYNESDIDKTIAEALDNVIPLCANCHRMVHRRRERMLTLNELRQIIND